MRLLTVLLSLLLALALLSEARPSRPTSLNLQDRNLDDDDGIAIDRVPRRQSEKIKMLEYNKVPSLSKYFSMHEW